MMPDLSDNPLLPNKVLFDNQARAYKADGASGNMVIDTSVCLAMIAEIFTARTRPPASSMEGWRLVPEEPINIHLDELLGEFKPCQLILREAGITEYVYEDCPTVAVPVVAGVYHAVDWMVSFDGRLVGIQFWQIHPELAASPIPPEVMK